MTWLRPRVGVIALSGGGALLLGSCLGIGASSSEPVTKKDAGTGVDAAGLADGAWACSPKSCQQLGADCGDTSDGCGTIVACGSCPSGETCGAGGPNHCGVGSCTPTTCAATGAECGLIGDGCGSSLSCGSCSAPKTCSGAGQANHCGCTPTTCAAEGKDCGTLSDGCGGTLDCGSCSAGKKCGANQQSNVCGCEPTTCAAEAKNCGSIPDGCGGTLSCGSCAAPKTCGGLGVANVCACSPANCPPIYANSFEAPADFPTGWVVWQNCPTDTTWSAVRDVYPAPNGGGSNLRFHTTGFVSSCQYPGLYAQSPAIAALPGRTYRVLGTSRNAASIGATGVLFFDSADQQVGAGQVAWSSDAWQYNDDPVLVATSPPNTKTLRVRLALQTPSEFADFDLLEVYLEPL
ncbi:MAG: hypothetical protein IPI67_22905 [Myxococcales bacterium]|nr:hypothetical protein [Myxococcales bacterium]